MDESNGAITAEVMFADAPANDTAAPAETGAPATPAETGGDAGPGDTGAAGAGEAPASEPETDSGGEAEAESKDAGGGETPPEETDLRAKFEAMQKSLRAVAAERNDYKARVNELVAQVKQEQESLSRQPAPPPEATSPAQALAAQWDELITAGTFEDAGNFLGADYAGLPYDPNDRTVCMGDPNDITSWKTRTDAENMVYRHKHEQAQAELERAQQATKRQQLEQEIAKTKEDLDTRFQDTVRGLRETAFPFVSDKETQADIDEWIRSRSVTGFVDAGVTENDLIMYNEESIQKAVNVIYDQTIRMRKLVDKLVSQGSATLTTAAEREPVSTAGGNVATPRPQRLGDMDPDARSESIVNAFMKWAKK